MKHAFDFSEFGVLGIYWTGNQFGQDFQVVRKRVLLQCLQGFYFIIIRFHFFIYFFIYSFIVFLIYFVSYL